MLMKEIKTIASSKGIQAGKMKKSDLIREIQKNEGNNPCFLTSHGTCDQKNCLWREDCLK